MSELYALNESPHTQAAMTLEVARPPAYDGTHICIVAHGLNSGARSPHIQHIAKAYHQAGYATVIPNLCHSNPNHSTGDLSGFTIAGHIRDLRRTIEWTLSAQQTLGWKGGSFALAGHSMGGFASCYLAAREYTAQVRHLLAVSPFTSGARSLKARINTHFHPQGMEILRRDTPLAEQDWPQYSIYDHMEQLTMPVSAVVGADDTLTTPADIRDFCNALPHGVEMLIVENEHHCLVKDNIPALLAGRIAGLERAAASTPAHVYSGLSLSP